MLLSFRVSNHKSIREEQTLHMQPVYDKTRPALPVAAIFGANAAGKSNVIDAFAFMVNAVSDSFRGWRRTLVPRTPFLLDNESRRAESVYVVELLLNDARWIYGFSLDAVAVRDEWLHVYPHNRRRVVFDRSGSDIKIGSTSGVNRKLAKELTMAVPSSALFLSYLAEVDTEQAHLSDAGLIHRWFQASVNFLSTRDTLGNELALAHRLKAAEKDPVERSRIIGLLTAADVGIVDVEIEFILSGRPADTKRVSDHESALWAGADPVAVGHRFSGPAYADSRLVFHHGPGRRPLFFDQESHGTRAWLGYIGPALDALESGGLLVVDEIDTSLHPHLTTQLIGLFRDREINKKGAQLIFTTHDATLLGKYFGDEILGRDEIWLVEKRPDQATELFSLADFKARKDDNIERRYLTGSYGAIPQPGEPNFQDAVRGRSA